ncbi:glycosyltransferase family 2 protein [Rhizobium beringeri]|uniref:glycosyltransferase family 2 protein n=1 Tax=Rhizobium beringeri TaxID=3019934 RepID=UPI003CF4DEEF
MISVVIPALNEEDSIGETVHAVKAVLTSADIVPFEVVVVDDGSADKTGEIARAAGAKVIRHPHRAGYGRSLKDGIRAAAYETIAITDADGTYPVGDIPSLYARHREGFDMTVGARGGKHYRESLLKMPLRWVLKKLVEFTADRKVPDINSGLRIFHRSTVLSYFDHLCDTFSFTTSLTLAYMMTGRFVDYVPINYHKRVGKTKVKLLKDALKTFQYILEAAIYFNPLRIFLLLSGVVASSGLVSLLAALIIHLNVFFFIGVGAIISSIIVLSIGFLAVLLRQIMVKSVESSVTARHDIQADVSSTKATGHETWPSTVER